MGGRGRKNGGAGALIMHSLNIPSKGILQVVGVPVFAFLTVSSFCKDIIPLSTDPTPACGIVLVC